MATAPPTPIRSAAQSSDDASGPESECQVVHLRGSISRSADPDGHAQMRAVASTVGLELGLVEGESGFEPFDLGFTDDARAVASKCHRALLDAGAATIVCDAPEAVWLIRGVWPTWGLTVDAEVLHVSEWLDRQAIEGTTGGAVGYHDPAALVRRLGVVDAPRAVIGRLGVECLEFLRCRKEAMPAGSYYGEAQGAWVSTVAQERLASAARAGMSEIIVASPYDLRSLSGHDIAVTSLHAFVAKSCAG